MDNVEQLRYSYEPDYAASPQVRLTRFAPLNQQQQQLDQNQVGGHQEAAAAAAAALDESRRESHRLASLEMFHTSSNKDEDRKWPWLWESKQQQQQQHLSSATLELNGSQMAELDAGSLASSEPPNYSLEHEPFQVLWRQLGFEVDTRTYDKLIGRSIRKLKSLVFGSSGGGGGGGGMGEIPSDRRRVIFENLNGHIRSGEISAILGPSGAGKTSLLNAISSQASRYSGQVELIRSSKSRIRVSVIPQKDYLMERLTVKENLIFASKILNLDREFDHESNILRIAKMLNLMHCLRSSAASISGGEYKRVSIAQELLKRPDILILDEPTSGLDSLNCKNLIKSLRSLIEASKRGSIKPIAIVLTIHQPDVEVFHMFDHIYCMARGGRTIFEGHPSEALEVIRTYSGLSESLPLKQQQQQQINPANLLIEIASEFVYGPEPIERLNRYQRKQFEHRFNGCSQQQPPAPAQKQQAALEWPAAAAVAADTQVHDQHHHLFTQVELSTTTTTTTTTDRKHPYHQRQASMSSASTAASSTLSSSDYVRDKRLNSKVDHRGKFWQQTGLLIRRNLTSDIRNPLVTGAAIIFHLLIPFVMWIAYSKKIGTAKACPVIYREMEVLALASNETMAKLEGLQEELTVAIECSTMFFLSSYCFSLRSLSAAALSFPLGMHVLVKEARNGWYNVPAYVLAKSVASLPFEVVLPVFSVSLVYILLGMPSSEYEWRLGAIALVMTLISLISTIQGLIWGAISMDSVQTAIFLASSSSLPLVLLSGFTARIKQMPEFMQNISWLSLYRYSSDSINLIRFGHGICPCDSEMDNYLKTKESSFTDIPDRMKPLFSFYLTNNAPDEQASDNLNSSLAAAAVSNHIQGVSYDLVLNSTVRNDMLKRLEANEFDLFGRMAELLSKSFTYGTEITGCESVRSQLLTMIDAPQDSTLPFYFGGLLIMFICMNVLLFLVVKLQVRRSI